MKTTRIFISIRGDVAEERDKAKQVMNFLRQAGQSFTLASSLPTPPSPSLNQLSLEGSCVWKQETIAQK